MKGRLAISGVRTVAVGTGWRNYVFVLLDTDGGVTGLGEASLGGQTHAVLGAIKDLEPLLIGAGPFRIEHIWQQAYRHASPELPSSSADWVTTTGRRAWYHGSHPLPFGATTFFTKSAGEPPCRGEA